MVVAVLFARSDSVYKSLLGVDVWDIERDALVWPGGCPVVAHPPCRAWAGLRGLAKPGVGEKDLAIFAVDMVRKFGGVLEHPSRSLLWQSCGLALPGFGVDRWGGWTFPVYQSWWGHKADKATFLYVVGVSPGCLPAFPMVLGRSDFVVASSGRRKDGSRLRRGDVGWRPKISKADRERTPVLFARWLVDLAASCRPSVRGHGTG